ncbi:alpha/beta hydrolase [Nocardioides sp. Root1257]|uniref:alpha/beta hydrolase n=1 Tax=unclassified Nocardioides TaxID=2615069 RepID=UPI0006F271DD|nr:MULTISPECIES: alpha/beta hydrolase [unclassified Nocardioides]KQW52866.1 alpha/beta hydrolase [Nocardioides sp. Root1257]KRC55554.1 alpha/beta hydrolase [Nocardioides sp. Root224]
MTTGVFDDLVPDVLGEPYLAETISLPPDEEGPVVATLVVRRAAQPTTKAVLYVHGFCDYFFQTAYAEWWNERGYDFYAVDLRKYGRSLRPHQTPNYVTDLRDHFADIDASFHRVVERDGHDHVVISAHSTGGLIASLWANERQPAIAAMVLNSPWLDMQGGRLIQGVGTSVVKQIGARQPARLIPRTVGGHYGRSLHVEHDGEWLFNTDWKPLDSFPVSFGWLRAIRLGHEELHRGLDVGCPVLVLSSAGTRWPKEMGPDAHGFDIVLEVPQIRQWATAIGSHVTYVAIEGARHDVVLSLPEPRAKAYAELDRWLSTYVE